MSHFWKILDLALYTLFIYYCHQCSGVHRESPGDVKSFGGEKMEGSPINFIVLEEYCHIYCTPMISLFLNGILLSLFI